MRLTVALDPFWNFYICGNYHGVSIPCIFHITAADILLVHHNHTAGPSLPAFWFLSAPHIERTASRSHTRAAWICNQAGPERIFQNIRTADRQRLYRNPRTNNSGSTCHNWHSCLWGMLLLLNLLFSSLVLSLKNQFYFARRHSKTFWKYFNALEGITTIFAFVITNRQMAAVIDRAFIAFTFWAADPNINNYTGIGV